MAMGTRCLIIGLIAGIFALAFPPLLLVALAGCAAVFACLSCVRPIPRIGFVVLLNYGYWLLSGALSGGLGVASLVSPQFWRGEGRCFFFYLPLLAMCVMRIGQSELRFIVRTICILTVVGAVLCALWLVGFGDLFQAEEDAETGERTTATYFIGLMTSHTGAGAFWATVAAFLLAYSLSSRDKPIQALSIVAALLTLGTGGRAGTLGLVAVLTWLVFRGELLTRRNITFALPIVILVGAGSWSVGTLVPEINERMAEMFSPSTFSSIAETAQSQTLRDPTADFYSGADVEHHNLVVRVFLWKYALYSFSRSPLVGIGFGRYNDTNLEFAGIPHFANLAVDGENYFGSTIRWEQDQLMTSTGNAHNSYLHMLAETGIIGLALFLYLWFLMYQTCRSSRPAMAATVDQFDIAFCKGCQAAIVCLLASSLPGHALAAPSGGILLTTAIGAWVAYTRGRHPR